MLWSDGKCKSEGPPPVRPSPPPSYLAAKQTREEQAPSTFPVTLRADPRRDTLQPRAHDQNANVTQLPQAPAADKHPFAGACQPSSLVHRPRPIRPAPPARETTSCSADEAAVHSSADILASRCSADTSVAVLDSSAARVGKRCRAVVSPISPVPVEPGVREASLFVRRSCRSAAVASSCRLDSEKAASTAAGIQARVSAGWRGAAQRAFNDAIICRFYTTPGACRVELPCVLQLADLGAGAFSCRSPEHQPHGAPTPANRWVLCGCGRSSSGSGEWVEAGECGLVCRKCFESWGCKADCPDSVLWGRLCGEPLAGSHGPDVPGRGQCLNDGTLNLDVDPKVIRHRKYCSRDVLSPGAADVFAAYAADAAAAYAAKAVCEGLAGGDEVRLQRDWVEEGGFGGGINVATLTSGELARLVEGIWAAAHGVVCPDVKVQQILDPAHPCVLGGTGGPVYGVFAARPVKKYSVLGQYVGVVSLDSDKNSNSSGQGDPAGLSFYALEMPLLPLPGSGGRLRTVKLFVDATDVGNEMGLINDFRNTGHKVNNAEYCGVWIKGWPAVVVVTIRELAAGEEVLADYGEEWWQEFEKRRLAALSNAQEGAG